MRSLIFLDEVSRRGSFFWALENLWSNLGQREKCECTVGLFFVLGILLMVG